MTLEVEALIGPEAHPRINELAALRIRVFRDWPYLYQGSMSYEQDYLRTYLDCGSALVVIARDADHVVGCATAIPLEFETANIRSPLEAGRSAMDVLYFGESVLLPDYRGLGVGHRFFDHREHYARQLKRGWCAFCAVDRSPNDPRKPPMARALDHFWQGRGYQRSPTLKASISWQETTSDESIDHELSFWLRTTPES